MTNKTTQQYQKGIGELDEKFEWTDFSGDIGDFVLCKKEGRYATEETERNEIKSHIKQHTLSILQSEYDRLEGEKKSIEDFTLSDNFPQTMSENVYAQGYNTAIQNQQSHILQTINEIKGL